MTNNNDIYDNITNNDGYCDTLMPKEYFERKYAEQKKIIDDFFEKYKELHKDENQECKSSGINISSIDGVSASITMPNNIDDTFITNTITESQNILNGSKCMHMVNVTYDYITKRYVSYCTLCGKILDSQSLNNDDDIKPRMISESKITKIGKKDKNSVKKDKDNNTRK